HARFQAVDAGDTVGHLDDGAHVFHLQLALIGLDLLLDYGCNFFGTDAQGTATPSWSRPFPSLAWANYARRRFRLPSRRRSPIRTTTPPTRAGSVRGRTRTSLPMTASRRRMLCRPASERSTAVMTSASTMFLAVNTVW